MLRINMLSKADKVKGQGVLSAYEEQVRLVQETLGGDFDCVVNQHRFCDIMHYHTINPTFFLGVPFAKLFGKTVGYVHFLPETVETSLQMPAFAKNVFYKYLIRFYKSMDHLVTVNPCFIDRLAAYGVDPQKVTYIPNFVSDEQFYPVSDVKKQRLRLDYGIDQSAFVVFCAGQLQRRKGLFEYVALAEKMPDVTFLWAGNFAFGAISDGYEDIQKILDNPPANLKFLGLVEREQMNDYYNMANVMFLPSYEELFPMTVLEAMNCGTPILLRDLDIYPDILFDFYEKGSDNEAFEEILRRLQTDKTYYRQASQNAYRGHLFYSRENVSRMWQRFYRDIAPQKPETPKRQNKGLIPSFISRQ